ncbi:hypothetical protein JHK87_002089 [Glycine soja]|nr:hypothetical protein JHK87_002089 [Glycine soja]
MVSDASKKKAAQKKVVSVAVMAAASFNGPDKVANGIAKIQISDWTCTSLQRYSKGNRHGSIAVFEAKKKVKRRN